MMFKTAFQNGSKGLSSIPSLGKRGIALFLAVSLGFPAGLSYAGPANAVEENQAPKPVELFKVSIPAELGSIREKFEGRDGKTIFIIQDAHAVPEAQKRIRQLIEFSRKEHGIRLVGLESAASEIDPQLFKSFPDAEVLKKVFDGYARQGELTGGNAAAIFSSGAKMKFYGMEDWKLYEEGVRNFLEASSQEETFKKTLAEISEQLAGEKQKQYSPQLLAVDQALARFEDNALTLPETLKALAKVLPPENDSELQLLLSEMKAAGDDETSLDAELKKIEEAIQSALPDSSREARAQLNQKSQEFQTGRISAEMYALFLKEVSIQNKIRVQVSRKISQRAEKQKRLKDIEGTRLFDDFEKYARTIKEMLFRGAGEKALDQKSRQLLLAGRLSRLELTREDWKELSGLLTQWDAWTVTRDGVDESGDIEQLVRKMSPHLAFYRNAEQRDLAMIARMEELLKKEKAKSAVMIAGGFHAQGLTQQLREKGISYCLIMPAMSALPEEIAYREHMQGNVSWKNYFQAENGKISLYSAFVRGTRDLLLNESGEASGMLLKRWRDQLIRDLSDQGRITEAPDYTRFLDETVLKNKNEMTAQWRKNVERFTQGLRRLRAEHRMTEQNIASLFKPASTGDAATYALLAPRSLITEDLLPAEFGRSRAENRPLTQVTRSYFSYPQAHLAENQSLEDLLVQLRAVLSGSVNISRNPITILAPITGGAQQMNMSRIHSPGPIQVIGLRSHADTPANQITSVEIFDDQEHVMASLKQFLSQSYSGQTFDLEIGVASMPSGTRDMALITARGNAQPSMIGNPVFKYVPDSPELTYNNVMGFSPATPPGAFVRKFRSRSEVREIILETSEPGELPKIGAGSEAVAIADEYLQRANHAVREGRFHDARDAYDLADYRLGTVPYENRGKVAAFRQQIKARLNELNQKLGTRLTLGGVSSGTVPGRIAPLFPVMTDMLRAVRRRRGIPMTQRVVFKDVGVGLGKGFAGGFTMTEFSRHLIENAGVSDVINIGTDSDKHIVEAAQEDQSNLIQQLPLPIRQRVKVQVVYGDFDRPIDPALPKPDITLISNVLKHYYLSPDPSYSPAEYARVIAKVQSEMPEHGILVIAENSRPIPNQPEILELKAVYYKTTNPLHPLTAEEITNGFDEPGISGGVSSEVPLQAGVRNESRDAVLETDMKTIQNNPEESWQISKAEETMKVMEAAAELPDFHDWLSEVMTAADERSPDSIQTIINSIIRYAGPKTADRFLERRPHLEGILSSFQDIIDPPMRGPLWDQASLAGKAMLLEIYRNDYVFLTRVAAQTEENPFIRLDALIRFEAVTAFNPNFNKADFEEILNSGDIRHFFENPDFTGKSFWDMSGEVNAKMPRAILMKVMVLQAILDAAGTLEIPDNDLKPVMNFAALSGILFPSPEEPPYLAKADFKMSKPLLEIASAAQLMIIFTHEMGHGALYMKAVLGKFSAESSFMDVIHEFFSDIVSYASMKRYRVTLQELQDLARRWIEESPAVRRGPFHAHNSARSVDFGDPGRAPWREAARFIYKYISDLSGNPALAAEMTQAYFVRRQILKVDDAVSDAAQLRLFQSLLPMTEQEALKILSNDSDAAQDEPETLRRSRARIQAVQNLWDKALQEAAASDGAPETARPENRSIEDFQKAPVPQSLEEVRQFLSDTIDWVLAKGYPFPEILRNYQKALLAAQEMPAALAAVNFLSRKSPDPKDEKVWTLSLNSNAWSQRIKKMKEPGADVARIFIEEIASVQVREAWGLAQSSQAQPEQGKFLELMNRILVEERTKVPAAAVTFPPNDGFKSFLKLKDPEVLELTALAVGHEFYEASKQYQFFEWAAGQNIYNWPDVAAPDTRLNRLLKSKGDAGNIIEGELFQGIMAVLRSYANRNTVKDAFLKVYYAYFSLEAGQGRIFQDLVLKNLSTPDEKFPTGVFTQSAARLAARVTALAAFWDQRILEQRAEKREIEFDEGLSVTLDDSSTEALVNGWNVLVRARNAEDPQRVRVPDSRNRHLKRFLREVFQIYRTEVYWQDRSHPETSIEPVRRYLDFFMFVLMDDDVETRRAMIEHLMGGVNPLPGDTRNYDYRHVNPQFFDYVREHLENPVLSLDQRWGNPVGLNGYERERGILNKRLALLSYFFSGSAGVMKNQELLSWLRPYFYNIAANENSLETFRETFSEIDLSKRPFELLRSENSAPFMKLAAMFYLESGFRNSSYLYSDETEEQKQNRPPYVFLFYHLDDLMTEPVYVMNGRYPAQEIPKEFQTVHLMLLTELARRLRASADFSGENSRYLRFLENAVDYYERTRGDRHRFFGKFFDHPMIKNDPDPRVQQVLASRAESRAAVNELKLLRPELGLRSILLVEDLRDMREKFRNALQQDGREITLAEDGQAGLDAVLGKGENINEAFDLIIMDTDMPRLSGTQLIQELRRRGFEGPIVWYTGRPRDRERDGLVVRKPHGNFYWHYELSSRFQHPNTLMTHRSLAGPDDFAKRVLSFIADGLNRGESVNKALLDPDGIESADEEELKKLIDNTVDGALFSKEKAFVEELALKHPQLFTQAIWEQLISKFSPETELKKSGKAAEIISKILNYRMTDAFTVDVMINLLNAMKSRFSLTLKGYTFPEGRSLDAIQTLASNHLSFFADPRFAEFLDQLDREFSQAEINFNAILRDQLNEAERGVLSSVESALEQYQSNKSSFDLYRELALEERSENRKLENPAVSQGAKNIVNALNPLNSGKVTEAETRQIYEASLQDFEGLLAGISRALEENLTALEGQESNGALALRGALELAKGLLTGHPPNLKVIFAVNFSKTSDPASFFEEIIKDVSDGGVFAKILSDDHTHEAFSKKMNRTLKEFLQLGKLTSRDWTLGMKTEDDLLGVATAVDDEMAVDAMADMFQGLFFNAEGMPADPDTQLAGRVLFAAFLIKLAVITAQNKTKQFRSASERSAFLKGELIKAVGEVQSVKIGNAVFDMRNGKLIRIMGNQLMAALVQSMKARAQMQQAA